MTKDIIIGGVSISTLKAQRTAMRQEANKFVADAVSEAKALVEQILDGDADTDYEGLAAQALEKLENAELVADVTGVTYFLDYYEEYGDMTPLSSRFDDSENEHIPARWGDGHSVKLHALVGQLESMEATVRDWHSSTC